MAEGIYKITEMFEEELCRYTGAPFAIALDCCSNAIYLSLLREDIKGKEITIPARTFISVPCEIIRAGGHVRFAPTQKDTLKGAYRLEPTRVWDSALRFTNDMYISGSLMCLSFSGPYKRLKLVKGGAILTDNREDASWFKRKRMSGRREVSFHEDTFDMLGYNMYMLPELSVRGVMFMKSFYDRYGNPIPQEDVELPYPNLSDFDVYKQ